MTERVVDWVSGSSRVKHATYQTARGWVFILWPDGGRTDTSVAVPQNAMGSGFRGSAPKLEAVETPS